MSSKLENHIWRKDCLEGLQSLPKGSVDLVFADPPFNIGYEYDEYQDARDEADYLSWCEKWLKQVQRVLSPQGTFWLAIGDEFAAQLKLLMQKKCKLHCRSWVIWYYTFGVNCKKNFSRSHTHLFYMVKDPSNFKFNPDVIRVPSARQLVYADKRAHGAGRLPDNTWILRPQDSPDAFDAEENTWYFARVCGTFNERAGWHGCQMPEQLLGRIIKACSDSGDLVLDPFAGSGSTLAVAKKLGRRYLGYEISAEYVRNIERRLRGVKAGDPLDGVVDPRKSVPATKQGRRLDELQQNGKRPRPTRAKTAGQMLLPGVE